MQNFNLETISKQKLFWLLQLLGWGAYSIVFIWDNVWFNTDDNTPTECTYYIFVLFGFSGLLFSMILRFVYKRILNKSFLIFLSTAFVLCFVLSLIWTGIKRLYLWSTLYPDVMEDWLTGKLEWPAVFFSYTNSFFLFVVWSAFYYAINYHFKLLEQTKKIAAIEADHARSKLKLLRYQLNPHFLFNSLNAASNLALRGDGEMTSDVLAKLSQFIRYSLDISPTEQLSLQQDLTAMKKYLDIEVIRFGDRLSVVWDVDEKTNQVLVPSFLIQPLIENVIKHALVNMKEAAFIKISSQLVWNKLVLTVEDNGPLTSTEPVLNGSGIGVKNIKERLSLFYGDNFELNLSINEPSGLKVEIVIPSKLEES